MGEVRITDEMVEAARAKGRELAGNQPRALVEAMAEIAEQGARAALSATLSGMAEPVKVKLSELLDGQGRIEEFPATPPASGLREDAALVGIRETVEEVGGWWKACSGCYDTEDGHPTQEYGYSRALNTPVGCGCHECGGLGAVWEYYSEADLAAMQEEFLSPPASDQSEDTARLDWLDTVNMRANGWNKTVYGWKFDINHNRAALTDCNLPALTVREAIDAARFPDRASEITLKSVREQKRRADFDRARAALNQEGK